VCSVDQVAWVIIISFALSSSPFFVFLPLFLSLPFTFFLFFIPLFLPFPFLLSFSLFFPYPFLFLFPFFHLFFCVHVRAFNIWSTISPQRCKIDAWSAWIIHRKKTTTSRMVTWPMTSRDPKRTRSWPHYRWGAIFPYQCKVDAWRRWTIYGKVLVMNRMVSWLTIFMV